MNVSYEAYRRNVKELESLRSDAEAAKKDVQAALTNEQITRQRVERIEGLLSRGFRGRCTWLLFGR